MTAKPKTGKMTDDRLPLFKILKWWIDEYGKKGNEDYDVEQFGNDYKYELLDLIEKARQQGIAEERQRGMRIWQSTVLQAEKREARAEATKEGDGK